MQCYFFIGKDACDAHGAIAHRKVNRHLRSRSEKTEYRKVCTPQELFVAISADGGLQNGGVQLLDMDRVHLDEMDQLLDKTVGKKAKDYFSHACVYTFFPDDTEGTAKEWTTAKYQIHVQAYGGIGTGAFFDVDLEEKSFGVVYRQPYRS